MARKPEDNVQFIKRLMERAPTGALSQLFIIDAIAKHADAVAAAKPIVHGLIDGNAWKRTAEFIRDEINARS